MIYRSPQNQYSHLTVKERDKPSLPVRHLMERNLLQGRILDFGSGLGTDVDYLRKHGLDASGYDPYYQPEYPQDKFDCILCNFVLNVLLPEEQTYVLMAVAELLKPDGKAYFAVRRDIRRNGFRYNPKHEVNTYQTNVRLPFKTQHRTKYMEMYEYQHYPTLHAGNPNISPFFCSAKAPELITETARAFAICDGYPVSEGHALIIPKRRVPNFFDLSPKEQTALFMVVERVKQLLDKRYRPKGYNIGINVGQAAGQTVDHVHIHFIPRYSGDVPDPVGGVRNIIPRKGRY